MMARNVIPKALVAICKASKTKFYPKLLADPSEVLTNVSKQRLS